MMEFINHDVIKIIRRKICSLQIFLLPQRFHGGKNQALILLFAFPREKAIVITATHMLKRRSSLLQDLLPMGNKKHFRIRLGIKGCQIGLPNAGSRMDKGLIRPLYPGLLQIVQCFNLRSAGPADSCARPIPCGEKRLWFPPSSGILPQYIIIGQNRIPVINVLKSLIKLTILLRLFPAVQPIVPFHRLA